MSPVCTYASNLLASCFCIFIMHKFMKAFFSRPSGNPRRFAIWIVYYLLQMVPVLGVAASPMVLFSLNIVLVFIISFVSYDASSKKCGIFSILVCGVWMLMKTATSIILGLIGMNGWELETAGTVILLMLLFLLAVFVGHYVKRGNRWDIPLGHVMVILTVPASSIYLMHSIFRIASQHEEYATFAIISSFLLLLLVCMMIEAYDCMASDAEMQEKGLLYRRELDLLNRQAQEREQYDMEMMRLQHDMKLPMSNLLNVLQEDDTDQAQEYVRRMLQETLDCLTEGISHTDNDAVDSPENPYDNSHIPILWGTEKESEKP